MNDACDGLRQRKKLATRNKLRAVALDLALEHGLEGLTVDMIAERAGVSRRTFFNYFPTKEEALLSDTNLCTRTLQAHFEQRPTQELLVESTRAILCAPEVLEELGIDRARSRARHLLAWQNPSLLAKQLEADSRSERALAEVIARRLGVTTTEDMRPAVVAGAINATVRVAMRYWAHNNDAEISNCLNRAFDALAQEMKGLGK